MNQQGIEFLNAFEKYVKRRMADPKMAGFDQQSHVIKFGQYLQALGVGPDLHTFLMEQMGKMLGPESPGRSGSDPQP